MKSYILNVMLMVAIPFTNALDVPKPIVLEQIGSSAIELPETPLQAGSLQVSLSSWDDKGHADSYDALQKIVRYWDEHNIAKQYLVYSSDEIGNASFRWEAVPYEGCRTIVGRIWQQFLVLWRIIFGGKSLSHTKQEALQHQYSELPQLKSLARATNAVALGTDPFCKPEVINRQQVLEGRLIRVLYNYAPIGFGGERLHFLLLPKAHKRTFAELSKEEYIEAAMLVATLKEQLAKTRKIEDVYLFHKTGLDAGQTVPHWHMHMILTSNKAQNFFGKLTVLKNMLFGSSPMTPTQLEKKVTLLREELN